MIGQIQLLNVDYSKAKYLLNEVEIIRIANLHCQSMVKRGGGVKAVRHRQLSDTMIVIELLIDVKEAMGANITNTVLEGVSPYIQSLVEGS